MNKKDRPLLKNTLRGISMPVVVLVGMLMVPAVALVVGTKFLIESIKGFEQIDWDEKELEV